MFASVPEGSGEGMEVVMAHDILFLALANSTCWMHHEIRPQKASSSDPPTTGSSGDPRVTDHRSLASDVAHACDLEKEAAATATQAWRSRHRQTFPRGGRAFHHALTPHRSLSGRADGQLVWRRIPGAAGPPETGGPLPRPWARQRPSRALGFPPAAPAGGLLAPLAGEVDAESQVSDIGTVLVDR